MPECQLQYDNFAVQVTTSDASHLAWLGEFLSPAFKMNQAGTPQWSIVISMENQSSQYFFEQSARQSTQEVDCFTRDGHFLRLPALVEKPGRCIAYDKHCQCTYRVDRSERTVKLRCWGEKYHARRALARVIRELATIHCLRRGDLPLHASAFTRGGTGFALAGPRRSGKTTYLMTELLGGNSEFIANDRVMLQLNQGKVVVRGMPTVIKLRAKMMAIFPDLAALQSERAYHREFLTTEKQPPLNEILQSGGAKLSGSQLTELVSCRAVGEKPLGSILFPSVSNRSGETQFQILRPAEAYDLLIGSLLFPDPQFRFSALFSGPDEAPVDFMQLSQRCVEVIRSTNCYRVQVACHPIPNLTIKNNDLKIA